MLVIMAKRGRHSKLTDELLTKICKYIEAGNYAKTACLACGISEVTFYDWIKKGEQAINEGKDNKYTKFLKSIKEARAKAEIRNVAIINKAATDNAKHAEWWLERTNPEYWGRKDEFHLEHSGKIDIELFKKYLQENKKYEKQKEK